MTTIPTMKWKQQLLLFVFQIVVVQQAGNLYLSVLRSDWLQLHGLPFLGSRAPPTGGSEQCLQINPRISFTKNHELLLLSNYVQYIAVLSPTLNTTWPTLKNSTIIIWGFIKSCRCLMLFTTKVGYLLLIMNCTMQWYKWPKSTSQYKVVHFNIPYGFMFKTQCN